MTQFPIQYLHLETGVTLIFIGMILWTQMQRTSEPAHHIPAGGAQAAWLTAFFLVLLVAFASQLFKVSPLMALELAAGCTLSLLHPVNALCFFVHMLFLRPWEIVPDNALLLALPRLLSALCFISWMLHPSRHAKPSRRAYRSLNWILGFSVWLFLSTFFTPRIADSQTEWFGTYFKSIITL